MRPDQVFAANGSNEVLQTLLLTYAGPGRTVVTFEPTYQLHAHIARITGATVVEGERAADFTLDPDEAARVVATRPAGRDVPVLAEQPDRARRGPVDGPRCCSTWRPGWSWSTRPTPSSPTGPRSTSSREDLPLVRRADVLQDVEHGRRPASATSSAPSWVVAKLEKVVLPYHLDAAKQVAGRLALGHVDEMDARVKQIVVERERVVDALGRLPVDVVPERRQLRAVPGPRDGPATGHDVWQGLVDRSVLVRDCSGWPRLDGLPAGHHRHAGRERPLPRRADGRSSRR